MEAEKIKKELRKFKEIKIETKVEKNQKEIIKILIDASKIIEKIFFKQVYEKNEKLNEKLKTEIEKDPLNKQKKELYSLFLLNYGPFNRLNHNEPFIKGHTKPKGAGFYPKNISKKEIDEFIKKNPETKKEILNPYTIIKKEEKKIKTIKYSKEYKKELEEISDLLLKATKLTKNKTLKKFLEKRSKALQTNNYYESEKAWLDLNGEIEITIGPYEVYEDNLLGIKTSFESFIGIVDEKSTKELEHFEKLISLLGKQLPITISEKQTRRGKCSPIKIVNEIYCAGDCRAGVQFTAYNLPNDEKIRKEKGSKKVMIKNIAKAKYEHCWIPIIKEILTEKEQKEVSFEAYFTHVLLHEISHALGPTNSIIKEENSKKLKNQLNNEQSKQKNKEKNNRNKIESEKPVNEALKEQYSALEEAKADVLAVHNAIILTKENIFTTEFEKQIITSFIGGIFRSIRFGINEAHGKANMIIYNYLEQTKAIRMKEKLEINYEEAKKSFTKLAKKILTIQATGNYDLAVKLTSEYGQMNQNIKNKIKKMEYIPIDIRPIFSEEYLNTKSDN